MNAIGYVWVSTDRQADGGVSLEAQEQKVRAMAVVQGATLTEVIVDAGESAKSLSRPGMARLLAEQASVSQMAALAVEGLTARETAAELTRRGLTTRRGTKWRFHYVAAALRTWRVCGVAAAE
jgi:hypothetical protein